MSNSPRDPTQRFTGRAEHYVRGRPHYPQALLEFCKRELGLKPGDKVADIGSGTGILSELFLSGGCKVYAVEPNADMREAAENELAKFPNFHSVNGAAEATSLADRSMQFVVAGQAFHWFKRDAARREFSRILAPGGWAAIVWNQRRIEPGSFDADYEQLVKQFRTDSAMNHRAMMEKDSQVMREFFQPGHVQSQQFDNAHSMDLDGVIARAFSASNIPLPGQPGCDELMKQLREIFQKHEKNGRVAQESDTRIFYGRLNNV